MKKFLVFGLVVAVLFIACDFASDSFEKSVDIEVVYMNPMAWVTSEVDTIHYALIEETGFIAMNSVDATIFKFVWEYYDANDVLYFGPFETAIYLKVPGVLTRRGDESEQDTVYILNIPLPIDTVRSYAFKHGVYDARCQLRFIARDDYEWGSEDTVTTDFGFQITPSK
jgi:hypothetical protein